MFFSYTRTTYQKPRGSINVDLRESRTHTFVFASSSSRGVQLRGSAVGGAQSSTGRRAVRVDRFSLVSLVVPGWCASVLFCFFAPQTMVSTARRTTVKGLMGPAEGSDHLFLLPQRALGMDSTHLRQDLAGLDFNLHLLHTAPRGNVWLCEWCFLGGWDQLIDITSTPSRRCFERSRRIPDAINIPVRLFDTWKYRRRENICNKKNVPTSSAVFSRRRVRKNDFI